MGAFIWVIILVVFISKVVKAQGNTGKPQQGQQYNRQPTQQYNRQSVQNTLERAAGQISRQITQQVEQQRKQQLEQQRKQQELKERLQQRYGSCQQVPQSKSTLTQQGDILKRATANVMENAHDELEHKMEPAKHSVIPKESKAAGTADDVDTNELMKQVDDLIIMGYQSKLSFERDFVAEGIELLNRVEVPDIVQNV